MKLKLKTFNFEELEKGNGDWKSAFSKIKPNYEYGIVGRT